MRSTAIDGPPAQARRGWEAPVVTELPIGTQTRASTPTSSSGRGQEPPPPAPAPATKLGFAFEMSFPLSARTDS
jgi:hypothetical protein